MNDQSHKMMFFEQKIPDLSTYTTEGIVKALSKTWGGNFKRICLSQPP